MCVACEVKIIGFLTVKTKILNKEHQIVGDRLLHIDLGLSVAQFLMVVFALN